MTPTHPSHRRFRRLGAAAALALLLAPVAAACSASGDDDADDQTTTEVVEETTTTVEDDETTTTVEEEPEETTTTTESRGSEPGDDVMIEAFIDGAATGLVNDPTIGMDRSQAECTATSWAETLGPERIGDTSLSPESFAQGDAELAGQMVDGMTDCGLDLDQMMSDELTINQGLTQTQADCVIGELPPGALREVIALEMAGELQGNDDPIIDIFFNAGVACADA